MNITKTEALQHAFGHHLFTVICASFVVRNPSLFSWILLFAVIWAISTASDSIYPHKKDPNGAKRLMLLLYPTIFMGTLLQQPVIDRINNTTESIRTIVYVGVLINLAITLILYWHYFTQAKHVEIPEPAPNRKDE